MMWGIVTKYFDFNPLIFVCASSVIVSLAPQVLLARDGALAAALCSGAGDFSLLPHVALLLAHCYHRPHSSIILCQGDHPAHKEITNHFQGQ